MLDLYKNTLSPLVDKKKIFTLLAQSGPWPALAQPLWPGAMLGWGQGSARGGLALKGWAKGRSKQVGPGLAWPVDSVIRSDTNVCVLYEVKQT